MKILLTCVLHDIKIMLRCERTIKVVVVVLMNFDDYILGKKLALNCVKLM